MISDKQFNSMRDSMIDCVKENFLRDRKIHPVALIWDRSLELIKAVPFLASTQKEKHEFNIALRKTCEELKAIAVMFIGEAWKVTRKTDSEIEEIEKQYADDSDFSIRKLDDKKEVVAITFETFFGLDAITFDMDREKGELLNPKMSKRASGVFTDVLHS